MAIYVAGAQGPVTAADFELAVRTLTRAVSGASEEQWRNSTRGGVWQAANRLNHLLDELFPAIVQLAARGGVRDSVRPRTDAAPIDLKLAPRLAERGIADTLDAFDALTTMLALLLRTSSPDIRGFHYYGNYYGNADGEGFAAVGCMHVLAYGQEITGVMGVPFDPDPDLVERVLFRLFRDLPEIAEPWPTLLWATARGDLPGLPCRTEWRWFSMPRSEW